MINPFSFLILDHFHLTHLHRFQSGVVAFGGDTGTACGIDFHLRIGEGCFDDERVGNHADIGTKADQLHAFKGFFIPMRPTEVGFINDFRARDVKAVGNFPTFRALDAVRHGQFLALCRIKIILEMSISREENFAIKKRFYSTNCRRKQDFSNFWSGYFKRFKS